MISRTSNDVTADEDSLIHAWLRCVQSPGGLVGEQVDATPSATTTNGRTEKQRQAARVNGAKSRGPATAAGKSRSRTNAWKHGILARHIAPPDDFRGQRQLYLRIHAELVRELSPTTFTAWALVDSLAHDYVGLTRCRQMLEAVNQIAQLPPAEMQQWRVWRQAKIDQRMIQRVINSIDAGADLRLSTRAANNLAGQIVELVRTVDDDLRRYVAQQAASIDDVDVDAADDAAAFRQDASSTDLPPDGPDEIFEEDEVRELRRLQAVIQPLRRILRDRARLAAVLSGNDLPARGELPRLRLLLATLAKNAANRGMVGGRQDAELQNREHAHLLTLASDPRQLLLLSRYLRQTENAIERKLRRLQA